MAVQANKRFLLGEFSIEPGKRELKKGEQKLHLASRPFQVLLYLIEHRGQLVARSELLERFWQGKDVYDETLTKCVGAIRKGLDDRQDSPRFIETRYAEGYRYIGPLEEQIFPAANSGFEIERTRGVKVIVEEEEIHETASENEDARAVPVSPVALPDRPKRYHRTVPLALILITTIIAAGAFISYRSRSRSTVVAAAITPASRPINSIAVLPLKNLSGDPAQEYLCDGLTESLITELSKVRGLKVISRSSVFTLKGNEVDPREVGQKLGVAAILEGGVRRVADDMRVEIRLVSTEDGRVLWTSDNYDRSAADLFGVQDEIARGVTSGLRLKLDGSAERQLSKLYTSSREAYDDYLKGR